MSFLGDLFSGGAETRAADKDRVALAQYEPQAQGYLTQGYNTGQTALNQGIGAWAPLGTLGNQYAGASKMYLDALGVNGPDAARAAQSNFVTTPGYALSEAAGEDALNRRAGFGNMFASGNAAGDLMKFAQNNLYSTQYAPWLQGLQGAGQTGINTLTNVAQGQQAGYTGLANLAQTYAGNQAGVAGNVLAGNTSANALQASGEAAGAKNLLGAGMSLATLAMGGNPFGGSLTGGSGGGGFGSSLAGMAIGGIKNLFQPAAA